MSFTKAMYKFFVLYIHYYAKLFNQDTSFKELEKIQFINKI
jgi:hypothetical protein